MKIGQVDVCDDCGAAFTEHAGDCPRVGEPPPMVWTGQVNEAIKRRICGDLEGYAGVPRGDDEVTDKIALWTFGDDDAPVREDDVTTDEWT